MEGLIQLISVVIVFLIVLVVTFFTTKWIGTYQKNKSSVANIELLDAVRISQTQFIQIVKVGKRFLVVGVSKDSISVLTECNEDELNLTQLYSDDKLEDDRKETSNAFKSLLEKAKKKLPHN